MRIWRGCAPAWRWWWDGWTPRVGARAGGGRGGSWCRSGGGWADRGGALARGGQPRPGSGGHSPPTLSIASAISAWGERNPNATRVSRRILVLVDSTRALDSPSVSAAWMLARWVVIVLARATNAGMRQRLAHPSHASSST